MRLPSLGVILVGLIWATVAAVPALRHQVARGTYQDNGLIEVPLPHLEEAIQAAPKNPVLRAWKLDKQWRNIGGIGTLSTTPNAADVRKQVHENTAAFFREYDALIAKNPGNLHLRRKRLLLATGSGIVEEPHSVKYWRRQAATMRPPAQVPMAINPLNQAMLEAVVEQARQGGQLEPEDAFFPFAEAMALSSLGRGDEALKALQRAGTCTTFNDGIYDDVRQRLAFHRKWGVVEWDEKLLIGWSMLWPHLGGMRAITREMTYRGVDEYKAGRKAQAWQHWEAGLRAAKAFRTAQSHGPHASVIGILVAEALDAIVVQIAVKEALGYDPKMVPKDKSKGLSKEELLQRLVDRTEKFQQFARREGHPQLADLAGQELKAIVARRKHPQLGIGTKVFDTALGWKTPAARATVQLGWFGWHALLISALGAVGLVGAFLATRGGRESRVAKSTVWSLSSFFGALWIGVALWSASVGAGAGPYMTLYSLSGAQERAFNSVIPLNNDWESKFQWFLSLTILAAMLLYGLGWRRAQCKAEPLGPSRKPAWRCGQSIAWLGALLMSSLLWFRQLQIPSVGRNDSLIWLLWGFSVLLALFITWWSHRDQEAVAGRTFLFALCAALGLGASVLVTPQPSDLSFFAGLLMGITTLVLLSWNLLPIWQGRKQFLAGLRAPIEVGGRVLGNLALVLSLGYIVAVAALWPTRERLNRDVDSYYRMGEVEWLRAQK